MTVNVNLYVKERKNSPQCHVKSRDHAFSSATRFLDLGFNRLSHLLAVVSSLLNYAGKS